MFKVISSELKNIKEKYATPRKTQIIDAVLNYDIEETIQKESVIVTVTLQGYIKRGAHLVVLSNKKEVEKVNLALKQEMKTLLYKHYLLILIHKFYFFLQKVLYID